MAADGGFSLTITNFSSDSSYSVVASAGTVSIACADITVTGLDAGASSTVTVTGNRDGYAATSAHLDHR